MSENNSTNFNSFGKALKWTLDRRGNSQKWLAEQTEIDKGTISKYLSDELNPPRKRRIIRFGNLLGVEIKKQPNDNWTVIELGEDVDTSLSLIDREEAEQDADKRDERPQGDLLRTLELAERLIRQCRDEIDRKDWD